MLTTLILLAALGAPVTLHAAHKGGVAAVAISPDGALLASAGSLDKLVKLWDAKSGKAVRTAVAFAPTGLLAASLYSAPVIQLWRAGADAGSIDLPRPATALAFAPDARHLAAAVGDDVLILAVP